MSTTASQPIRRRGRPPASERTGDIRTAAIATASDLLIANGPGLSMESVARQLGVRTPSLYHHFPGGRDEMILAVATHYCGIFSTALGGIVEGTGPVRDKLLAVARYFAGTGSVHPYNVLGEEQSLITPASRDTLKSLFAEAVEAPLLALFHQGIATGELQTADPEMAMRSLLALLLRLTQMIGTPEQKATLPEFITDLVLHGIATEPRTAA